MPIQLSIVQPSGVTATYHVVENSMANFGRTPNASVTINSYLSSSAYTAGDQCLGSINQVDISPLVQNAIVAAPSLLYVIEQYLLTTSQFSGGSQVS